MWAREDARPPCDALGSEPCAYSSGLDREEWRNGSLMVLRHSPSRDLFCFFSGRSGRPTAAERTELMEFTAPPAQAMHAGIAHHLAAMGTSVGDLCPGVARTIERTVGSNDGRGRDVGPRYAESQSQRRCSQPVVPGRRVVEPAQRKGRIPQCGARPQRCRSSSRSRARRARFRRAQSRNEWRRQWDAQPGNGSSCCGPSGLAPSAVRSPGFQSHGPLTTSLAISGPSNYGISRGWATHMSRTMWDNCRGGNFANISRNRAAPVRPPQPSPSRSFPHDPSPCSP